jgi:two-component system chemotaxis response regulator CheY
MKFLIVEDDFTSRRVLVEHLSEFGTCAVAVTGKEALLAVEESCQRNDPYDLIFMDILMPEMDGQTCLQRLQVLKEKYGHAKSFPFNVVMTTGLSDEASIETAYGFGCEYYLVKPIDRERLVIVMTEMGLLQPARSEVQ